MHQIWLFGQLVILNVKKPVEQVPCACTEIVSKDKEKWTVPLILVHSLLLLSLSPCDSVRSRKGTNQYL